MLANDDAKMIAIREDSELLAVPLKVVYPNSATEFESEKKAQYVVMISTDINTRDLA